jgi:hypothetical protein
MIKKIKTLLSLTLLTHVSKAEVDIKDGRYYKTWVDLEIPTSTYNFELRRTYDSHSLHQGIFGFGWCSDFEKSLEFKKNRTVVLHDCQLRTDIEYERIDLHRYQSRKNPKEIILWHKENYLRKTQSSIQKYSPQGKLVYLSNHNGFHIKLHYHQTGHLKKVDVNSSAALTIKIDRRRNLVQSIMGAKDKYASYTYKDNNLASASTLTTGTTRFEYDDVHNLTKVVASDQKLTEMTYNKEKDWIIKIRDPQNCFEYFNWYRKNPQIVTSFQATTKKTCNGRIVSQRKFEFSRMRSTVKLSSSAGEQ